MRNSFWNKKIPTVLGLILIIVGLGVTTFLVRKGGFISINASPSQEPKNVRISNITDASFTVSYETTDQAIGVLNYGQTPSLGQSGLDDRDQQSNNVTNHKLHNMTIRNLSPETKYYFSVISGKDTYINNGNPFEVTTGTQINDTPSNQEPTSGKIILPNGDPPKEAIIYLTTDNSQVISTLIKEDGSFLLPLNSLRTSDLSSYFEFNNEQVLKILATGDNLTSNIILSLQQIKPVPTITLSSNYDFTSNLIPVASVSANTQSFPVFTSDTTSPTKSDKPEILTPKKDQGFSDQQPQFKGNAPANESIQIIIHSDEKIQTTVKADAGGNWSYRPTTPLSAGNHTITIIAKDASGALKTITQSFVVYASGSQLAGEAGSPTPTIAQTNNPTATPTKSISPTQTPTSTPDKTLSPTVIPTVQLTSSPTPTVTVLLSKAPTPPLPPTGNPTIITLGMVGVIIAFIGSLLFLLSRGSMYI